MVPPHVLPAGIGTALVAAGTDVLIVPALVMVVNVPLNMVAVPKSRVANATVDKVLFITNPVILAEEVTVEEADSTIL